MWSYFSRDPISNFNFDVGEVIDDLQGISLWRLHDGKTKASASGGERQVSIFGFDVKSATETQLETARSTVKRIKTLRHPTVITYIDSVENTNVIYVVTEHVVPLRSRLEELQKTPIAISWGLHQITKALDFLNLSCSLVHNNVSLGAIFTDKAGEWKLGGFEFMYGLEGPGGVPAIPPVKILPAAERYEPPERSVARVKKTEKWSTDVWGLGCLVWEIFNGEMSKSNDSLKSPGKIPPNLIANFCELVSANPKSRPKPSAFIDACREEGGFMANSFVETMLFIEEIQIKENEEKSRFFGTLTDAVDSFPDDVCRHKILPQLLLAYEFAGAGSAVLPPLFKLSRLLTEEEYQKKIVPSVVKLFSSSDRTTRVRLLQQCEFFIKHLQVATVNDQIFPQVVHGFMDTNPTVREHTIKAMVFMAEKLNYNNLNEELMKHFARLQSRDDQGGIRTNTTVCLGKIAGFLNPERRQKVLISAFCRALRDPFPPARQAGVLALAATHNYYTLNDVASKIIPPLALSSRDPEKAVRDQAFKAIKLFIAKLEKVSEHPEQAADLEKDVNSGNVQQASAVASWAGWAMGGVGSLTSKIYSKGSTPTTSSDTTSTATSSSTSSTTSTSTSATNAQSQSSVKTPSNGSVSKSSPPSAKPTPLVEDSSKNSLDRPKAETASSGWGDNDGDDDGWDDFGVDNEKLGLASPTSAGQGNSEWNDFDDGGWEDFGDMSSQPDNPPAASLHSKSLSSSTTLPPPPPPVNPTSSAPSVSASSSDGWGNDEFAPFDGDVKPASSYNWDSTPAASSAFTSSSSSTFPSSSSSPFTAAKLDPNSDSFFDDLPGAGSIVKKTSLNLSSKSKSPSPKPSAVGNAGISGGKTGNSTGTSAVTAKMAAMEAPSTADDGWDAWGGGDDAGTAANTAPAAAVTATSKAELMKQKREQRKQEMEKKRLAKNAGGGGGGGALKLGVRKVD